MTRMDHDRERRLDKVRKKRDGGLDDIAPAPTTRLPPRVKPSPGKPWWPKDYDWEAFADLGFDRDTALAWWRLGLTGDQVRDLVGKGITFGGAAELCEQYGGHQMAWRAAMRPPRDDPEE